MEARVMLKGGYIGDVIGEYYRGYSGEYYEFTLWLMSGQIGGLM